MQVFEEIGRKKSTYKTEDWKTTYNYLQNLLDTRFELDKVKEDSFTFNEEKGEASFDIGLEKEFDQYTKLEIDLSATFNLKENEVIINLTGILKTEYPEDTPFQRSATYFFLRTVWDRIYYGKIRKKYKDLGGGLLTKISKALLEISTE